MTDTAANPLFLIEFAKGVYAGNPTALRVSEQMKASLWADEAPALARARELGGQVVAWTPPAGVAATLHVLARRPKAEPAPRRATLTLVPTVAPIAARRRGGAKAEPPAPTPAPPAPAAKVARPPKGPARDEVVALLAATGLPLQVKSSDHYGDPKGARLVLPRSASVTRVFLYRMPDAADLLGYKTPDERKALGLGAVTHVAEVTELDQVRPLIEAVCVANGLTVAKAQRPATPGVRKRSRKATPAGGTPAVTTTEPQVTSSEAPAGQVEGNTTDESGVTQTVTSATPTAEEASPVNGGSK